jgi:hypothetical protein
LKVLSPTLFFYSPHSILLSPFSAVRFSACTLARILT